MISSIAVCFWSIKCPLWLCISKSSRIKELFNEKVARRWGLTGKGGMELSMLQNWGVQDVIFMVSGWWRFSQSPNQKQCLNLDRTQKCFNFLCLPAMEIGTAFPKRREKPGCHTYKSRADAHHHSWVDFWFYMMEHLQSVRMDDARHNTNGYHVALAEFN